MADIQSFVLKLATLQSIRFEIRLLGDPIHSDGNTALEPVHNKSLVFDINRTGDKLKQKLSIKPASQLAPKGVQKKRSFTHILPDKARNERKPLPLIKKLIKEKARINSLPGKRNSHIPKRLPCLTQRLLNNFRSRHGQNLTLVIYAKTSCTTGNLPYLASVQSPVILPVKLGKLPENNPSYRQRNTHADGIRGNNYGILTAGKLSNLLTP